MVNSGMTRNSRKDEPENLAGVAIVPVVRARVKVGSISSEQRFWPVEGYQPGKAPESFDKQYVRDYVLSLNWDTKPPVPTLPPEIVQKTQEKYAEALRRLTTSPGRCFGR